MKRAMLACAVLMIATAAQAIAVERWERVGVPATKANLDALLQAGADLEGAYGRNGRVYFFAQANQVLSWMEKGFPLVVVDQDVARSYAERLVKSAGFEGGFATGSMGGNFTYDEVQAKFDQLIKKNPSIISHRKKIGTTFEGRPIWAYKISDNVAKTEAEPNTMVTGLIHAREPQGMMSAVYFAQYLVDNYATDATAAWLVNNLQIWIVPVINPDGYVYNQMTNPAGGGQWRKNRHPSATDASVGVDLNRNYGYMWGYDNYGSSPYPNDETYRGTGPFSEPETKSMGRFCDAYNIRSSLMFHSYGHFFMYPWAYENAVPEPEFMSWAGVHIPFGTGFIVGNCMQALNYPSNGDSDDWMYSAHNDKAFTIEVGSDFDGFWPTKDRIEPLAKLTLNSCKRIAGLATGYLAIDSTALVDARGQVDTALNPGQNATLKIRFSNMGLPAGPSVVSVRVYSNDSQVVVTSGGSFLYSIGSLPGTRSRSVKVRGGAITKAGTAKVFAEYSIEGTVIYAAPISIPVAP